MEYTILASALVMGFMGSWHCGVMCGPLVCNFKKATQFSSYHIGRLISYISLGSLLFFGFKYFSEVDSRPVRIGISIFLGVILILFGLHQLSLISKTNLERRATSFLVKGQFWILKKTKFLTEKFPFILGLLTGFFPCSWLYSFLLLASQMKSWPMSVAVIIVFWFTSLPAFLVFTGFMQSLIKNSPTRYQKISGIILILAGLLTVFGHWIHVLQM